MWHMHLSLMWNLPICVFKHACLCLGRETRNGTMRDKDREVNVIHVTWKQKGAAV